MKRKTFVIAATTLGIGLPVAYYLKQRKHGYNNPVAVPAQLSIICDETTIKAIGQAFLKQHPGENSKQKLKAFILAEENGNAFSAKDNDALAEFIHVKILKEFNKDKTLLADGWVLAQTEARQCALFSLTY